MRWHKFISVILHPVVMPTVGVMIYFILSPSVITKQQQYALLSIVFISTYIIPILLLILLKALGSIKSYYLESIEERKLPLFFMITMFFIFGRVFFNNPMIRGLSYLFYGTSLSLLLVYFIFFTKTKTSLHLVSMGSVIGYFLVFQQLYGAAVIPLVAIFIVLSGLVAASRLHLKAHTPKEVYLGFFLGIISQFIVYWIL